LTIDATPRVSSTVTQDGQRLLVKFDADALDIALPAIQSQGIIEGIRMADALTIALDLGPRFASFRSSTEVLDDTARLAIDVTARPVDTSSTTATPASPTPSVTELPFGQRSIPIATLVIDAGHGGGDAGAKGAKGTLEKDLTLAVARRLKALVEGRLGIRVIMTREEDRSVPLDERAAVANNNKADFFISLHANASARPALRGASLYVAAFSDLDRAKVPAVPARLPVFGGGLRQIELVPWDLAQLRHVQRSYDAARFMAAELQRHVPLVDQAVAQAPFRVLESANMPAVLIEIGYLSNAEQEAQLANPDFQGTLAQGIMDAVVRFRDHLAASGGERGER
jgi:N-acetylmuramoyl-L-alanine amidase